MATTMSTQNKMGFMCVFPILLSSSDPKNANEKATTHIIAMVFHTICTFLTYCFAAKKVPLNAGIFNEPITVATGKFGIKISAVGVCISPPPPTIASIKPALNAAIHKSIKVMVSS